MGIGMFERMREDIAVIRDRDPAARSALEVMLLYNGFKAIRAHRKANWFYRHNMKFIARWISQRCVRRTNIEIHPAAQIGRRLFIDHGTGVVIGETCVIGKGCRLYQGVTLGALSFPKDENGLLVKGIPRHPILEDNVTVYAGATILGRVTIGKGAIIGGNVWVNHDVPPGERRIQSDAYRSTSDTLTGRR